MRVRPRRVPDAVPRCRPRSFGEFPKVEGSNSYGHLRARTSGVPTAGSDGGRLAVPYAVSNASNARGWSKALGVARRITVALRGERARTVDPRGWEAEGSAASRPVLMARSVLVKSVLVKT